MKGAETITRLRQGGPKNRHGERSGEPAKQPYERCVIWPRTSVETGEEVVIDGYNVFVPWPQTVEIDIEASDRVECRGEEWDVEGTPGDYRKGKKRKGLLLTLKKVGT